MFRATNSIAHQVSRQRSSSLCPVSLFDTYGRMHNYLRISLTERCNLRCRYCMPEKGVELTRINDCLSLGELKRLTDIFIKTCRISKIRLTGGEPTLDKKLVPLLEHLQNYRKEGLNTIALTTNGLNLKRHSTLYKQLGVDAVNISLDTLKPERFEFITRRKGLQMVLAGLHSAIEAGFHKVKLNCVVMREFNEDEILDFARLASIHQIEVRFIEFMPFAGNSWAADKLVTYRDLLEIIKVEYPFLEKIPSEQNSSSKSYRDSSMKGSIGFISSMSENFCSGCNRLRITSDGNLKVCLLGREETSLRDLIRYGASDEEIVKAIASSLYSKKKQHAGSTALKGDVYRPMIKIAARRYSTCGNSSFSHLNENGRARMVDIGSKPILKRTAIAQGRIFVGHEVLEKIYNGASKKGDVVNVAQIAGIMGAKLTSSLIPLCHQIPLDKVQVDIVPCKISESLIVEATVVAKHRTGVEMESLTAVSITLLTLYDMCKSASKFMRIEEIKLLSKSKEVPGS